MTIFFDHSHGYLRPISHIAVIGPEDRKPGKAIMRRLKMKGEDDWTDLLKYQADGILQTPVQLIPAEPGTRVIRVFDQEPKVWYARVIAWALCLDGEIRAVTPNGINDGIGYDGEAYVEMPTGEIEAVGEWTDPCRFDSADDMIKHFHPNIETTDEGAANG